MARDTTGSGIAPIWVARQVPREAKDVRVGTDLRVKATNKVSLGHRLLIASQDRRELVGLGVVLGEPMKRKGKQYIRAVLVTHSFGKRSVKVGRKLGAKQGARRALDSELRVAKEQAKENTPFSFVYAAAAAVARQLTPGTTREIDSEALLVAMIEACGYEGVARQVPVPGPRHPPTDTRGPKRLRADVIANVGGNPKRPELLVIEGEWTHIGGAESAAQAYEYSQLIMDAGALANGASLFGLSPRVVRKARFHALVVANRLLHECRVAERLDVKLMDYFEFADLLRHARFSRLEALSPSGT